MMKNFEIVDGTVKGTASAIVDISFDIHLADLECSLEGEAFDAENFIDIIRDNIEAEVIRYIEGTQFWLLGVHVGGGICVEDCNQTDVHELEIEAEVKEVEDDD
jgi:hypothetical protein